MEALLEAQKRVGGAFRGMIDGRTFEAGPFDGEAPAISADVPVMAGCTNTETTYYFRADPGNFALEVAEVRRRLTRFLELEAGEVDRVIEVYRDTYPGYQPSDVLIMVSSDFVFKRNTFRIASLQASSARKPVYAYVFDRETPVEGGRLRSPHTSEVPFIFGTAREAAAHVGAGADIGPMTECMMACWAGFARHGDPNNATISFWPRFDERGRQMMVLDVASRVAADLGGPARAALDTLPYFGYGHSIPALVTGR